MSAHELFLSLAGYCNLITFVCDTAEENGDVTMVTLFNSDCNIILALTFTISPLEQRESRRIVLPQTIACLSLHYYI